jgi:hypothetical protein
MAKAPPPISGPSVAGIFTGFFMIGVRGFGGVLPWARRTIVEERKWLTAAEFAEVLGLCQFLPGGNIINVSVALGSRFRGMAGHDPAIPFSTCRARGTAGGTTMTGRASTVDSQRFGRSV